MAGGVAAGRRHPEGCSTRARPRDRSPHGFSTEADALRVELQQIKPEDLDLQTISAAVEIPSAEVDAYIASIVDRENWRESLRHFGSDGPPGGQPEEIEDQLAEEREQWVFLQLFTKTVMGPETAATRFRTSDDASRQRLERAERRQWYARMWSPLAVDILDRKALRVADLELEDGVVRVERSWDQRAGPVAPKSRSGRRRVPICARLEGYLAGLEEGREPEALVFGRAGGRAFPAGGNDPAGPHGLAAVRDGPAHPGTSAATPTPPS